jgi:hypothetical protein
MIGHLLTDKELALLIEILENESKELSVESRHSATQEMKKDVRERLRTVDRIIERLREVKVGDYAP